MTVKIIGVDGAAEGVTVVAQFNPKEISIDRSVAWRQQALQGPADLEYVDSGTTTMAFELMFDGFETNTSVQPHIDKLHQLTNVDAALHRPPKVRVVYGAPRGAGVIPAFDGVIEMLAIKYVMFNETGAAVRATVAIKLKEADHLKVGKPV